MLVVMCRSMIRFELLLINVLHAFDFILKTEITFSILIKSLDFRFLQSL